MYVVHVTVPAVTQRRKSAEVVMLVSVEQRTAPTPMLRRDSALCVTIVTVHLRLCVEQMTVHHPRFLDPRH